MAASQRKSYYKLPATAGKGASFYHSYWLTPGLPAAGAADLRGPILKEADLGGAKLAGAKVTEKQLDTARSLEGATMPDGSVHD